VFRKVLIANRGEIAVRVMRTLREMGIRSVAVCSDADRSALHAAVADECVDLGDPAPAASYLNVAKLLEAAKRTGAEAVHPGYGFLSENPGFAQAVVDAGLVFIGPPAGVMARLGDKTAARRRMRECGVPIIPGMTETDADPDRLAAFAAEVGYPVLLKASMGGGGKGMRVVRDPSGLRESVAVASSEAKAAFGDGSIYLEKYLVRPRHVEFQILADQTGNTVHLFERECSIQRRHQKIVEETPSPAVDDELRERMGRAAVAAARGAGYVNAGTVEFLLAQDRSFYFLEVNTRLQVEHPITEWVTGLDLVRLQVQIAAGEPLPFRQEDLAQRGHAIECRIYAEDPEHGFLPSPGRVLLARTPEGPGVRYDSGIVTDSEVPVHYDPILGKLSVHAPDRPSAIARMERALGECVVLGVSTPIAFLMDLLRTEAFRSGDTHTGFLQEHLADWRQGAGGEDLAVLGSALERLAAPAGTGRGGPQPTATDADSPWHRLGAWDLGRRQR
jgi:acetyl-CoA carboxylase biotin carboxylase subunit